RIETTTPGFATRWVDSDNHSTIPIADITFTGAWEKEGDLMVHRGEEPASFEFEHAENVSDQRTFWFDFQTGSHDFNFTAYVDGTVVEVVEYNDMEAHSYPWELVAPYKPSSVLLWEINHTIFPVVHSLGLFLLVLAGISITLEKPQPGAFQIAQVLLASILLFIFWIALTDENELLSPLDIHNVIYPGLIGVIFIAIPILIHQWMRKKQHIAPYLILAIGLLAAGLRVYWVMMVPSAQVSDFGRFHNWALQLASGAPGLQIDRYANFTRALSLLYRVFPTHVAVEIVNILLAAGTAVCLYFIGKIHQQEHIGMIAAYFLAVYPAHIALTSTVNTDILSTFLLVLSVLLMSQYLRQHTIRYAALSGISLGVCIFFRGAMLIYLPVLVGMVFLQQKHTIRRYLIPIGITLAAVVLSVAGLNVLIDRVQAPELVIDESRYLMWPLVNGTNVKSLGRNNTDDTDLLYSWSPDEVNQRGWAVIKERLLSNPLGFLGILDDKFDYLLGNAAYGAAIAFVDETLDINSFQTRWNAPTQTVREIYAQLSQYAYLSILLLAGIAVLKTGQQQVHLWVPVLIILLCALGAYSFFEVQPRYSFPLIPFLILLAGMAFIRKERTE
ncbi:MAG: glycosyltransferase family 39 protein, partial [Anaerolineae bacterium]|nr:glycosyltransferase family 39 protein [Anaerolineae bacterium]